MYRRLAIVVCVLGLLWYPSRSDAATRTVCASGCNFSGLQAAIDASSFGDTILVRAGETFIGHYTLRAKPGSGVIVIRSDAPDADLPSASERLVPADRTGGNTARSLLPRLVGRGGAYRTVPLLRTDPGAHGYVLRFLEFDGVAHAGYETLIQLGTDTTATPPSDITLDRVYIHGHPYKGQKRGITLNGTKLSLLNSYVSDIKAVSVDAQAVLGYNGAGPLTIHNNYLEASGENILFGGADPAVANLVPSDISIRRNHLFKPLQWRNPILNPPSSPRAVAASGGSLPAGTHYFRVVAVMSTSSRIAVSAPSAEVSATVPGSGAASLSWARVSGADRYRVYRGLASGKQTVYRETIGTSLTYTGSGEASGTPAASGTKWLVKNTFELKNAARVTVDGNVLENSWAAGQVGYAIVLTPRNSGSAPWTRVQDVTFTNNIVRHVAGVANILGYDNTDRTLRTERITFRNNLFEDVTPSSYGTGARVLLVGDGAASLVFDSNTFVHTNSSALYAYGAAMPGVVFTNNVLQHHTYGIVGAGSTTGKPTLAKYFPDAVVRCNVFAGGAASLYPTPNTFLTTSQWTGSFADPAHGDYTVLADSPVAQGGCGGDVPGADMATLRAAAAGTATAQSQPAPAPDPQPAPAPSANRPPTADAGGPYAAAVGALLSVDGTASADPDGSTLDYRWHWADEILVRAADLPAAAIRGSEWVKTDLADAAGGTMILNPDRGAAKRSAALAAPGSYVEVTVNAAAGVPYYLWLRMRATRDAYTNDSLYVQFSGALDAAGSPLAKIGTTAGLSLILEAGSGEGVSGWGWTDAAYGHVAAPIYFAQSGPQTLRIQQREDGVGWDQLVLSSAAFQSPPGSAKGDNTQLDAHLGTGSGVSDTHRYARGGVYPLLLVVTDASGASAASATTVTVR